MQLTLTLHAIDCKGVRNAFTIRNIDSNLKMKLRLRAAQHGRSVEAEVREILLQTLNEHPEERNLAAAIHDRFKGVASEELPIPSRQEVRTPPDFGK